ncbi:MAG: hypothetical protein U0559_09585 [Anaerolineae bacterium]
MDPLTTAVTTLLGKYAIDKGATLIKEAGQAAANVAAKLFEKVLTRLKADPAEAKNADRFEQNPTGYAAPIADAVDEKLKSDPNFAAEIRHLLEEFEGARIIHGDVIDQSGSGAIATNGGVAAGAGGAAASGGGIAIVDNRQTLERSTTINKSGGVDIDATNVDVDGDVTGRDKVSG